MRVLLAGPLPPSQGGISMGGEATVVSELSRNLALLSDCEVYLYADNTYCKKASEWYSQDDQIHLFHRISGRKIFKLKELSKLFGIYTFLRTYSQSKWNVIQQKVMKSEPNYKHTTSFLYYKKIIDLIKPDLIHAHHATSRPITSMLASDNRIPIVTTLHSFNGLLTANHEEFKNMYKKCFELSGKMIAVSTFVKQQALELGADEEKIEVIPNGVDIRKFRPFSMNESRSKLNLNLQREIVLFTGNLIERKGVDFLLKAFAGVRGAMEDALLVIVGSGPEEKKLRNIVADLSLKESVLFVGEKDQEELPFWYNACDIFVLPSRSEGLSISLLEALSCGKPVITCYPDIGQYDAIENGITGYLIQYGNVRELTKRMLNTLKNNSLSKELGGKARDEVESNYSWELIAQKTFNLYKKVKENG